MIKISVLVTTLNEEARLPACLSALQKFDEVIVIDSNSADGTADVAQSFGARVENFEWNVKYPKKRQWALDHLNIKNDFIFFVDADEIVTADLFEEIKALNLLAAGYFVNGRYIWNGRPLKHGLINNKLVLFNRHKIEFPIVDDLDIEGMGEMEGHYQPVLKTAFKNERIEQLNAPLIHEAYEGWEARHQRYARWEAEMIAREGYPKDPKPWRETLKRVFRKIPIRGVIAFLHSYVFKLGFLDGCAGYDFARSRLQYYQMVSVSLKANKALGKIGGVGKAKSGI